MARSPQNTMRLPLLAGWLFADLMLVLFLIGLATGPAIGPAPAVTSKAAPKPSAPPAPRVVERKYYRVTVSVDLAALQSGSASADKRLIQGANAQIAKLVARYPTLSGRQVGVALIFGAGPIGAISTATEQAKIAGGVLVARDPAFHAALPVPLWTQGPSTYLQIYLFFYSK